MNNTAFNFEIRRKAFHICAIAMPILYLLTSKIIMGIILTIIAGTTLYIDISRHYDKKIKGVIDKFLGQFLRFSEKTGSFALSGASYMAFGFLITCLFFSQGLAITSWLILIISDSFAALIGMKFGSPVINGKSYIGSAAFFLSAIFISILSYFTIGYTTSFMIIIISSFFATLVELFSKQIGIDDNFSIPVTYALSTFILGLML
ncbi:MAG: hypothetical protein COA94_04005 [Rickettsiales bacterium]|nr:MAG: hypothetical protein COA94_04005 [Rickettsiales bacterium]